MSTKSMQYSLIVIVITIGFLFVNTTRIAFNPSPWKTVAFSANVKNDVQQFGGYGYKSGSEPSGIGGMGMPGSSYIVDLHQNIVPNIENCDYRVKIVKKLYNGFDQKLYWNKIYLPIEQVATTTNYSSSIIFTINIKDTIAEGYFLNQGFEPAPAQTAKLNIQLSKDLQNEFSTMVVWIVNDFNTNSPKDDLQFYLQEKCPNNESSTTSTTTTISPVQTSNLRK